MKCWGGMLGRPRQSKLYRSSDVLIQENSGHGLGFALRSVPQCVEFRTQIQPQGESGTPRES